MIEVRDQTNPFTKAWIVGRDVAPSEYHNPASKSNRGDAGFVMSRSELMEFSHCPRRWINGFVSKESTSTQYGTLMDCLFTQPGSFETRFQIEPETYPSDTKSQIVQKPWTYQANFCKKWRDEVLAEGRTPVSPEDVAEAKQAIAVLRADETIASLADESATQVFVLAEYNDADTGLTIPVKALIDLVPPVDGPFGKTLIDFKTAASAAHGPWKRAVFDHSYHVQAALYLDAYCAATGEERIDWFFIISENYKPWEIGKRMLSAEFVNLGRVRYTDALERYCRCLKTGVFPSYDTDPMGLSYHGFNLCDIDAWMVMQ